MAGRELAEPVRDDSVCELSLPGCRAPLPRCGSPHSGSSSARGAALRYLPRRTPTWGGTPGIRPPAARFSWTSWPGRETWLN
jgi:hypothetical protein